MLRGRNEDLLTVDIEVDADDVSPVKPCEKIVANAYDIPVNGSGANVFLMDVARWTWRVKLSLHLGLELMTAARERAEEEAISVFAANLKDLLLAAPAGTKTTMGLDPGIRTGVKVAVVDATAKVVATATVYPFQPKNDVRGTLETLSMLVRKHKVELIAIGNGTGSRETDRLVAEMLGNMPAPKPIKVTVSEAGASVYSASALAAAEMPDLDVTLRGAVSIARRLQDPLAELVKIEPKAIGVGQYQHDVDQGRLAKALDAVVEDAVNGVGVDLNTASPRFWRACRVWGRRLPKPSSRIAMRMVRSAPARASWMCRVSAREPSNSRRASSGSAMATSRLMPRPCIRKPIARQSHREGLRPRCPHMIGDSAMLKSLNPREFVDESFGLPTVIDIIAELDKPGRDPRPVFKTAAFADGVEEISDLKPGMMLEGTVTNVAAFGAFVDIGVHQDGLVHVSQLADKFVKDPRDVVKAGDVVKVRVVEVDVKRKRISLSMRKDDGQPASGWPGCRTPQRAGRPARRRQPGRQAADAGGPGEQCVRGGVCPRAGQAVRAVPLPSSH